nr:zinc finger, CCHC-type [Tanacetum cinerariifolium]
MTKFNDMVQYCPKLVDKFQRMLKDEIHEIVSPFKCTITKDLLGRARTREADLDKKNNKEKKELKSEQEGYILFGLPGSRQQKFLVLRFFDIKEQQGIDRNMGFNESEAYKKTFIGSGVGTGSMQVLHGFEFEVEPLGDHTFEVVRDREQHLACELFGYRKDSNEAAFAVAVVEKIYAHESLTFNNTVACDVISKWKAGLKDDMDARLDVYVLSNGCRKCSDDNDDYYWEYTPAKGNILSMEIVRDHSGDCEVEKNGKWSCTYAAGSQEYQMGCTRPNIASTDVSMLDGFDRGLQTYVQVFIDFDHAMGRSITRCSKQTIEYGEIRECGVAKSKRACILNDRERVKARVIEASFEKKKIKDVPVVSKFSEVIGQLRAREENVPKMAFRTHYGHYELVVILEAHECTIGFHGSHEPGLLPKVPETETEPRRVSLVPGTPIDLFDVHVEWRRVKTKLEVGDDELEAYFPILMYIGEVGILRQYNHKRMFNVVDITIAFRVLSELDKGIQANEEPSFNLDTTSNSIKPLDEGLLLNKEPSPIVSTIPNEGVPVTSSSHGKNVNTLDDSESDVGEGDDETENFTMMIMIHMMISSFVVERRTSLRLIC